MEATPEERNNKEHKPGTSKVIHSSEPRIQMTPGMGHQPSNVNSLG